MPPVDLGNKFKAFGFDVYEINGNDMEEMVNALDLAVSVKNGRPKCIFGHTVKGNGVSYMENQVGWHGNRSQQGAVRAGHGRARAAVRRVLKEGLEMSEIVKKATRDGFGDEIVELGRANSNVLVVDVDIGKSCKTGAFHKELPAQYLNVGIAEQNAAGVAAGLATCGKIPFVVTYAAFGSMRMVEMIRQEACYPHLNVKLACSHGGVTPANDGASHQCIEDMGILSTIPT